MRMICACYEVVSTQAEKEARIRNFMDRMEIDGRLTAIFVDVVPSYDFPRAGRTGLQALMEAARKKQFNTLMIPYYESLKMDEHALMVTLLQIHRMGIRIYLEQARCTVFESHIIRDINKLQIEYLLALLEDPRIADGICFVDDRFEPPFVYLPGDLPQNAPVDGQQTFRRLIFSDPEQDLCLYRRDRDDWLYIPGYLKESLQKHFPPRSANFI